MDKPEQLFTLLLVLPSSSQSEQPVVVGNGWRAECARRHMTLVMVADGPPRERFNMGASTEPGVASWQIRDSASSLLK